MCDSVRQKLGHTMKPIEILSLSTLILPQGILILSLYDPINTEMGEPSGTTDFLVFVDLGQFTQSSWKKLEKKYFSGASWDDKWKIQEVWSL